MHVLKRWLVARIWRHSAMAALLCTIVVMLNMLIGLIAFKMFYSFWFGVAVYAFTPIWLVSFGLFFSARWKWHELALGVFVALFVITLFAMRDLDGMRFQLATGLFFSLTGAFAVSLGSITAAIGRLIRRDVRDTLAKRKLRKSQAGSTGTPFKG